VDEMVSTRVSPVAADEARGSSADPEPGPCCAVGWIFQEDKDVVIERRYGDIRVGETGQGELRSDGAGDVHKRQRGRDGRG
jgi:hypothetical protein